MKKALLNLLQFLFFLGVGVGILFLVFKHQNKAYTDECCIKSIPAWESIQSEQQKQALLEQCRQTDLAQTGCLPLTEKLLADFKSTNFAWIALVLLAFVISNINRTYKWKMLLKPMGYHPRFINGFLAILVGYFANLGLPRMGEVVRAGLLSRYENIPVEKVMGTIVVDRIVDVLCLGGAFLLALIFESEKIWGYILTNRSAGNGSDAGGIWLLLLLAGGLFSILLLVFRQQILKNKIVGKVINLVKGFWEGIQTIRRLETPGLFVYHSVSIWILFFLMTWLGFQSFGPTAHLDLRAALTVFVFGTLGFVIPSPGGMGTFHALVIASLTTFYAIKGNDAFAIANIIFFSVSIGFNVLLGLISLILLPLINKNRK
jgi:hypothetical protein